VGILRSPNIELHACNPQTGWYFSSMPLFRVGMNIPVIVSASSTYLKTPNAVPCSSPALLAHLDTGATLTSIDIKLAHHMGLIPVGTSKMRTAAGPAKYSAFTVDLQFPNSTLSPHIDLPISSCDLGFDLNKPLNDPGNFGLLIGRDVMSAWNIAWNGPTSTVIIND